MKIGAFMIFTVLYVGFVYPIAGSWQSFYRATFQEHKHKGWNAIKTNDSWAIFKIMGEFVNGFEKMSKIGPCVSIFGSHLET